jgi:LacI family repressor for deo operon, udp, cdd, tsx, nupC, and nupG
MKAAGLEPRIERADFSIAGGAEAIDQLMSAGAPTAVFMASDTMALGALSELRRRGIDVPGDLSVAGFDDIPGLEFIDPRLTTVHVPMLEIGAAGVARLLRQLDEGDTNTRTELHAVHLVVRESTGKPREVARAG